MEYIIVKVKQGDEPPKPHWISPRNSIMLLSVLINGEPNGITGKKLQIESGYSEISVATLADFTAETVKIKISANSTSIVSPKEVVINVTNKTINPIA